MIDAAEAARIGLVSRVVAHEKLLETAVEIGDRIAANPVHAVRMAKRLLRESEHVRFKALIEMSTAYQSILHGTKDHAEALASMIEKCKPVLTGL